jgi:hypothetical protein
MSKYSITGKREKINHPPTFIVFTTLPFNHSLLADSWEFFSFPKLLFPPHFFTHLNIKNLLNMNVLAFGLSLHHFTAWKPPRMLHISSIFNCIHFIPQYKSYTRFYFQLYAIHDAAAILDVYN